MKIKPLNELNFSEKIPNSLHIESTLRQEDMSSDSKNNQKSKTKSILIISVLLIGGMILFATDLTLINAKAEQVVTTGNTPTKLSPEVTQDTIATSTAAEEQLLDRLAREYPAPSLRVDQESQQTHQEQKAIQNQNSQLFTKIAQVKDNTETKPLYFFEQHTEKNLPYEDSSKNKTADEIFLYGIELAKAGDWQQAQENFFIAYDMQPTQADFAFNLAVSLDQLNLKNQALLFYKKSIELTQQGSPYQFNIQQVDNRIIHIENLIRG